MLLGWGEMQLEPVPRPWLLGPDCILSQIGGHCAKIPSVFIFLIICCEMCSFSSHDEVVGTNSHASMECVKLKTDRAEERELSLKTNVEPFCCQSGWGFLRYPSGMARAASPGPCACPQPSFIPSP